MPRQARLDAPGTLHHVMVRGIERTALFRDDQDRADFVARLARVAERGALGMGDVASEFSLRSGGAAMTPGPDSMRPASSS